MDKEAFIKEFKALLEKYDASIWMNQDGEGYSATVTMELSIGNTIVLEEVNEIDKHTFND